MGLSTKDVKLQRQERRSAFVEKKKAYKENYVEKGLMLNTDYFFLKQLHGNDSKIMMTADQLSLKKNIFVKLVDKDLNPVEINGVSLLIWEFREDWQKVYKQTQSPANSKSKRYVVPATELKVATGVDFENQDLPFKEMTVKDFCAITWKKPISNKKWLNDLIKKQGF